METTMMDLQTAPQVIEAILFVAGEPVKISDLAIALGLDESRPPKRWK